jgi:glutathione S-transferase
VPVLVLDDGEVLTEGAAILQYLADQATDKHLAPANGSMARYRLQEWLNFIATEIHKGFGVLWQPGSSAELKQGALERLSQRFSYIEQQLGQQSFVLGEFSVADAYLFTCLSWTRPLKISLQAWPGLVSYLERVAARPAVQVALREEGLI